MVRLAGSLLLLALGSSCSGSSPPASGPQHANFVVVSLDMEFGAAKTPPPVGLCDPRQYTPFEMSRNGCHATYPAIAHGVFRNHGAAGTAVVVFTAADLGQTCSTVLANTPPGSTVEGSCPLGGTGVTNPTPSTLSAAIQSS